jgi:uncharacterized repeat protein (TIGR01451 family)
MRVGKEGVTTLRKANTVILATLLILGTFVLATLPPDPGDEPENVPSWEDAEWINYSFRGQPIRDWEDKPYENDPTHGIANVQPKAVDIASGVDASGGGADNNPGNYTSVQYFYYDWNDDSDGFDNIDDDWLFLRMRVAEDPQHGGKYYYKAYHWDILLEVDGDIFSEFVVDLNGGGGYFKFGTIGVYYNNSEDYEYDPDLDWVWLMEASSDSNTFTRAVSIDYDNEDDDDDQYWIEYKIPVTAFIDSNNEYRINEDTDFLLFFSSSASATNPLQKDWMGEYVFGEPASITVEKTVEEDIVSPGDTLHYKIYYNNTGDFKANNVWVNDTIPDYTTVVSYSPTPDSIDPDGRTYRWHFTDVERGNYTIYLNVTVDSDVPDGEILKNVVALNHTDDHDEEKPGSEDETENPVEGPFMEFSKDVDSATANPGDIFNYTLTLTNTGSGGAYNVVVVDTLPDGVNFLSSDPIPTSEVGNVLTWEIDVIPGNNVTYINIEVQVPAFTEDETFLVNHAQMDHEDVNENTYDTLEDWANVTINSPLMTISKTTGVTEANPGDEITYTISYENTGTGDAHDVVIVDTIPDYTTLVSATLTPDSNEDGVLTWNLGTVSGETSGSISITVKVDVDTPDTTVLNNTVTLDYEDPNDNSYPQESDYVVVTVKAPIISIEKEVDAEEADPGAILTYTLTYVNSGTGTAAHVWVNDTIPEYTTFYETDNEDYEESGGTYSWHFTDVGPGTYTITLKVKIDVGTNPGANLTNTVTMDYTDANENPFDTQEDSVSTIVKAPDMSITKEADGTEYNPGDIITYTITYVNDGNGNAGDVWINDTIPDHTTFKSANPTYSDVSGSTYIWHFTDVEPGTYTITLEVTVDVGTAPTTSLVNIVTLDFTDANGNQPYDTQEDSVTVTVTAPSMIINKEADCEEADPGDIISYTLTYKNIGNGIAGNVWVNDTLPDHTTYHSSNPTYSDIDGSTYIWYFTDVGPGTYTITLNVSVDIGTDPLTELENVVTLDYTDDNDNQPYNTLTDSVTVTVTAPSMTIGKEADTTVADPGDIITYTLTYKNLGNGIAAHVWINDTLPTYTTYHSSNPAYSDVDGSTYIWHFTDVEPGTYTITLNVTVDIGTDPETVLENVVTMEYTDNNSNQPYDTQEDSVTVEVTAPNITIEKEADCLVADPGDRITYTITYKNLGNGNAAHVWINDTIPDYTTYHSSNPHYDDVDGSTYIWHFTDVEPGTYTITLKVKVDTDTPSGTYLENVVTLDYTDDNGNQPYDTQSDSVIVAVTAPVMTIEKEADCTVADPGDVITYTLTYKNVGTGNAAHVWVNDTIPAYTSFESSTPNYYDVDGSTYTWYFTDVAPGTYTITVEVSVDIATPHGTELENFVTLDYTDDNGNQPYDTEEDSVIVTVTAPIMTIEKEANTAVADPGDFITYTLTYKNLGNGDAAHVWVNDTIPTYTTYYSSTPNYNETDGSTYTWHFTGVGPGSYTITLIVTVDIATPPGTVLENVVTLDYTDDNGNQPYDTQDDSVNVTVTAPDMTIKKEANTTTADPGDIITYTLTYENLGNGIAAHVWVNDTIPTYTTYLSSNPAYSDVDGSTYIWYFTDVGQGTYTITLNVTVDIGTPPGEVLENVVTLDYTDDNGNQPYDTETDTITVTVTAPEMTIEKEANCTEADPGDVITYTLTYKNLGNGIAAHVWVNDTIPTYTTYHSSNPAYTDVDGSTYIWYFTDVEPGTYTITLNVTVDVGTDPETELENVVTLDYTDNNTNQPYDTETDTVTITVTAPDMTIEKTVNVSDADPGDIINYTITYTNDGNGIAAHVWINDTIPTHTTYVTSSPTYTSVSGSSYTWHLTDVEPGTYTIYIEVKVDIGTEPETLLENIVTLEYTDNNSNQPYDTQDDSVTIFVTAPDMTIIKEADCTTADPSDEITYTITYKNLGNGIAAHVWINDTIPAETSYVSSNPTYHSVSGDTYMWHFTGVAPGTYSITIKVKVDAGTLDGTDLINSASLDYTDANGNQPYDTQNSTASVIVTAPGMIITKTTNTAKADPGDTITYTIYYENTGNGDATDVVITDYLPENVTFDDANPYPNSTTSTKLTWNLGTVPGNSNGTITVYLIVNVGTADGTLLTNSVVVEYDDDNGNPQDDEDDSSDVTVTAPIMTFSKIANVTIADPSDLIQYTLTYNNIGSGNATQVKVTDTLSSYVTLESNDPAYSSFIGNVITWNIGLVEGYSGGTITINVSVNVGVPDGTLLVNKAVYDYSDANGNSYDPITDYANVTVTAPILTVSKTADTLAADPSDSIEYTIEYENLGTGEATDIVIIDTIPADTTFVSSNPAYDWKDGDSYYWNFTSIADGAGGSISIIVEVDAYTPDATLLANLVTLDYDDANGNSYPQKSDYANVTVTAPNMIIVKVADVNNADPGDEIYYTITYINEGTGLATNVVIIDTIPENTTFVNSTPTYDLDSGDTYTWNNIINIGPSASGTIVIKVTVDVGVDDETILHNIATLDYDDANGNPYDQENDTADVLVTAPVFTFSKCGCKGRVNPGDDVRFRFLYENIGTGDATNVTIIDILPEELTYNYSSIEPDSIVGNIYTWNIGDVEAGTGGLIYMYIIVNEGLPDGLEIINPGTLDYADANGNPYEQMLDRAWLYVTAPVMSINKDADVNYADPGDTIIYTITYNNSGGGEATDVMITDTIPANTTFVSSSPGYDNVSGDAYTWIFESVEALSNGTITITVTVDVGTADETLLHNIATLDYDDANGNPYDQENDTADVLVTAPVFTFSK